MFGVSGDSGIALAGSSVGYSPTGLFTTLSIERDVEGGLAGGDRIASVGCDPPGRTEVDPFVCAEKVAGDDTSTLEADADACG